MHITVPITQYDAEYSWLGTIQRVNFFVNRKPPYFMYCGILLLTAQPGRWDLLALWSLVVARHAIPKNLCLSAQRPPILSTADSLC